MIEKVSASNLSKIETMRSCSSSGGMGIENVLKAFNPKFLIVEPVF